jgi:hypothetical protein
VSTRQRREVPAAGVRLVELEAEQARVAIRWAETDTISIEHDPELDLSVEPADDQAYIGAVGPASGGVSRVKVSEQGIVVRLGDRGGISIGPQGIELEGLGLGRRRKTSAVPGVYPLALTLPRSLPELVVTVRRGALFLDGPRGRVKASLDDGELTVQGGEGQLAGATGSGDVLVEGFSGEVELAAGSGEVALRGVTGSVTVTTGSGDVVVREGRGPLSLSIGSGDVQVVACDCPSLSIKTGSGQVSVRESSVEETTVKAGSGDISSQAWLGLGRHEYATSSGDISVALPRGLPARIEVTTRGDVESSIPLVVVGQRGPRSAFGRRLVGSVGEGSGRRAEVIVRSNQGDVRLGWLERPEPVVARPAPPPPPEAAGDEAPPAQHETTATPDDEARAILEALSQGQITVEEAQFLLDRLLR